MMSSMPHRLSFAARINFYVAIIVAVSGALAAWLAVRVAADALLAETRLRGRTLVGNLAVRGAEPILAADFLRLSDLVLEVAASPGEVRYAFLTDAGGNVLAHTFQGGFPVDLETANPVPAGAQNASALLDTGLELIDDFASEVSLHGTRIGTAHVGLPRSAVDAARLRLTWSIVGGAAGVAFVGVLCGSLFARRLTRRLDHLRAAAEEIVRGNLGVRTTGLSKMNCWEIMGCENRGCPAWGEESLRCWQVAGTLCPECSSSGCESCVVYRKGGGDELDRLAVAFDAMSAALARHIGELHATQNDLGRKKELLRTIFDVTPDLMTLQDESLVYQAVNKAFCRFLGKAEDEILGRAVEDVFGPGQAEKNRQEDSQVMETGMPVSREVFVESGETRRWLHLVKVPVYASGDARRITGLLMSARDISVVKRYQEQLVQSQKMEDLGRLAGGVAHEINTPLSIILGYAQMLLEDLPAGSREREDVALIEKQAKVCRRIVADLLGFSRGLERSHAEMGLNQSILEVLDIVRPIFRQDQVEIETQLDEDVPPLVADKDKLKQVWMNLASNARDAIGQGGGTIVVRTKLCKHRRRVVVSVADTGSGISQENLSHIFDPFFTTKPPGSGTGLGLSVSFGIIKDHKGRISVLSPAPVEYLGTGAAGQRPPGPGTVFIVELPLTPDGLPEDECEDVSA